MGKADRDAQAKRWQASHPRHWWALERMEVGEFRDSLVEAMETGRMTTRREMYLWHLATKLEREARGEVVTAPTKGTRGAWRLYITKAEWGDNKFGDHVFRVDFLSPEGWRGRWETTNEGHVVMIKDRTSDDVLLKGTVKWSREDYGIIGGRVTVSFPAA
jgi:hypothetical protein